MRSSAAPRRHPISKVFVLATGGTISSRDHGGGLVASDRANDLVSRLASSGNALPGDVEVWAEDLIRKGSYLLSPEDMVGMARRVRAVLGDDDVAGVVVTHGTDTMEESAYLLDLVHDDDRPVVFTGAQRAPGMVASDGPQNLADALRVASDPAARGIGVVIVFEGQIHAASGATKVHTLASAAFGSRSSGALGSVWGGAVAIGSTPRRHRVIALEALRGQPARVDIVPYYPGADVTALRAVVAAGARGIVLEATGVGNANPAFCAEIERLTATGVVVALTTRVPHGPVAGIYGAGGGTDLIGAGAVPAGMLRASQARILLFALLTAERDPDRARTAFALRAGEPPSFVTDGQPTDPPANKTENKTERKKVEK